MLYLTKKAQFNAAHRLYNPSWSDEKNTEVFGECANPYWHGHNFDIEVTVKGYPNPDTGMVMNFKDLSRLIKLYVIEAIDHKNINIEVPFMQGVIPSAENLIVKIWEELERALNSEFPHVKLHRIRLFETQNSLAEYYGPQ